MDSATTLAIAMAEGYEVYALSFDYGQRHRIELDAAVLIAERAGVARHMIVKIDTEVFAGSALTTGGEVPKRREMETVEDGIPPTYVPARNTVFLSFAVALAEVLNANDIFIGVSAIDCSGYVDCRPEFVEAFERMANLATKAAVEDGRRLSIRTPLIALSKAETVRKGLELGVDYGLTRTCYDPSPEGAACGLCDSCRLRLKGFRELGLIDPAPYQDPADLKSGDRVAASGT